MGHNKKPYQEIEPNFYIQNGPGSRQGL